MPVIMRGAACFALAASRQNSWDGECERAALAWITFYTYLAAVQFYNHFDDSQAESLTAGAPGVVQRDLIEALEDALLVFGGDAATGIAHLNDEAFAGLSIGSGIFKHA